MTPRDLSAPAWDGADHSLGDELLVPSVIYAPTVLALCRELGNAVHACAHITGGGIVGNVARILTPDLDAMIEMDSFETPEIFFEIQRRGRACTPTRWCASSTADSAWWWHSIRAPPDAAVTLARANGVPRDDGRVRSESGSWQGRGVLSDARERVRQHLLEHSVRRRRLLS